MSDTDELAGLVRRYRQLDISAREIADEQADIKARVRKLLDVGDRVPVDGKPVAVQPNRRFDPGLAERVLTPEWLAACTVKKVDSAAAKKILPPALYEACMAEVGDPRVVIA